MDNLLKEKSKREETWVWLDSEVKTEECRAAAFPTVIKHEIFYINVIF